MTPEAYGRLMRGKLLDPLADAIAKIVADGSKDIVVFNYIKKEQALFAHVYFHYPMDLDEILRHPGVSTILQIRDAKDTEIVDRAIVSHDALNFKDEEPTAGFAIEQGACRRDDAFDAGTIDVFDALIGRHFFRFTDDMSPGGTQWLKNHRIVDSKLRRKAERHLEARRLQIARERLPHATSLEPVRLCNRYHYNGRFVLNSGSGLRPLPEIDPESFRQTAYGAADAEHVVVGGHHVLRTDPARFRMLSKSETTFYVGADGVYDDKLNPIPGADAGTFRLTHYAFARDKARWYTWRGAPLDDVGDRGRIEDALYFSESCLLMGERSIHLGADRLPLHAPSCRLKRAEQLREGGCFGGLLWFVDDEGDCIVSKMGRYGQKSELDVMRTKTPEAAWDGEAARWKRFVTDSEPAWDILQRQRRASLDSDEARRAFVAFFEEWHAGHFSECWRDDPYISTIWEAIDKYFDCLLKLSMPGKVIDLYERIRSDAWFHPSLFGRAASAFMALDQADRAVEEIRNAVLYDVYGIGELFDRPEFSTLADRPDMIRLRAFHDFLEEVARYRPLTTELARYFLDARPSEMRSKIGNGIIRGNFYIPPAELRARLCDGDAARIAAYEQVLAAFVNECMRDEDIRRIAAYEARKQYSAWGDLPGLHPVTHLFAASQLYEEGFFWIDMDTPNLPRQEFRWAELALRRAKATVQAGQQWANDDLWLKISADPGYAPLLT